MSFELLRYFRHGVRNRVVLAVALFFCLVLSCVAQSTPATSGLAKASVESDNLGATGYVVGVADVLDIHVWKEPELSRSSVAVRPDGMISMPLIGEVKVSGMTPSQIHDVLVSLLGKYLSAAQVSVTVAEIKSKFVYVTGEVNKPGVYALLAPIDVLQVITRAGGLTPFARSKSIAILRSVDGKQQKLSVNYKKLLRGETAELNIRLLPGDMVVVP